MDNNNNSNNYNNYKNIEALDLLAIIGFVAQMQNMEDDNQEKKFIHNVIQVIATEIEKLHQQNERIENKLDEIIGLLKTED